MNVWEEMDRLTEPAFAASPLRTLSREEIEALQQAGAITPVAEIPRVRYESGRVCYPTWWFKGGYARPGRR